MRSVTGIYCEADQLVLFASLARCPTVAAVFVLGMSTGLRIGDMLALTVGQLGPQFTAYESKVDKFRDIELNPVSWIYMQSYLDHIGRQGREYHEPLFKTTRQTVYRHMRAAAEELGISGPIGTHSMRKTYAWTIWRLSRCLNAVQEALGHEYPSSTIAYLVQGFSWLTEAVYGEEVKSCA